MCGINGFFSFANIKDSDVANVADMAESMRHRGPDDVGYYNDDKIAISQVRLSIIDLKSGKQPIFNEDGSLVIVCNGEIYNYQELRQDLIKRGHVFKTESDTEVIVHLFEEKKEKCLDDLRGMYAIAIYDNVNKSLFIARDTAGKKPLYYSQTPKGFAFSSEVTPIKDYILEKFDIDVEEIKSYLKHSYSQSLSKTYISQIKKIEAGQYAYIDDKGVSLKRYWKKKNTYSYQGSYIDAKKQTLDILREAVELRLRSDVPVAILLSGGIDSSAILSLATQNHNNIHAITVGYKGMPDNDERDVAKRFAKERGAVWHEIELDEDDFEKYFYEYTKYIDEPDGDLSSIPQYAIYKKARELGFTVLLTGNGGDELFYGYPAHNELANNMKTINELLHQKRDVKHYLKYIFRNRGKIKELIKHYSKDAYKNFYHGYYDIFDYKFDDDFTFSQTNFREKYYNDETKEIDQIYSYMFNIWLINNCNFCADKLAMACSAETRSPFEDKRLIEFVSSLPLEYKYHEKNPKGFLKDVLQGVVPDYILNAPKRGFNPGNAVNKLIERYEPKYFNTKCTGYPEVVMDKFLFDKLKNAENSIK